MTSERVCLDPEREPFLLRSIVVISPPHSFLGLFSTLRHQASQCHLKVIVAVLKSADYEGITYLVSPERYQLSTNLLLHSQQHDTKELTERSSPIVQMSLIACMHQIQYSTIV